MHKMYITGDMHGFPERMNNMEYPYNRDLGEGDILFQLGDFGYEFYGTQKESDVLDDMAKKPYTIAYIDGNHENYDLLKSHAVEMWNGGKVHVIRRDINGNQKVVHLMRGQVYQVNGKTIFTFGGAYTPDRYRRKKGIDVWDEELPTDEEMKEGLENLKANNNKVDFIFTHTLPEESLGEFYRPDEAEKRLTSYLEEIRETVSYEHWYAGHLHLDKRLFRRQTVLSFGVIDLDTGKSVPYNTRLTAARELDISDL